MAGDGCHFESPAERTDAWVENRLGSEVGLCHRVVHHLASGGMGHVFLAEHIQYGSRAAVKFSNPTSDVPAPLLRQEAALLRRIRHPNIVSVIEFGRTSDGYDYLLLEYLPGVELADWRTASRAQYAPTRVLKVLWQLAAAIDHLHSLSLVHGDLKPSNVMVDAYAGDRTRLIDFGLSFHEQDAGLHPSSAGTPGYMAPEQLRGELCGPAIDRFALAAIAFELITNRAVYASDSLRHVRKQAHAHASLFPHNGLACKALETVFARALDDDPSARFPRAGEFVAALEHALASAISPKAVAGSCLAA